ncbi:Probable magnesium transporter NIPA8 [Durusdinium trenchii]|uniref:Probable magnesium transporter NIPA8 n=1 Tax=Durusdinium trenchii TaxID=1381693 RepID=A0ABP0R131_9DINO
MRLPWPARVPALLLSLPLVEQGLGFLCSPPTTLVDQACDVPKGLNTCSDVVSFSSCMTEESWSAQDALVEERMQNLLDMYGLALNQSEACLDVVRRFQCAAAFPVCEGVDRHAEVLCESACKEVRRECDFDELTSNDDEIVVDIYTLDDQDFAQICFIGELESSEQCVPLDYTGPSYYLWAIGLGLAVLFSFLNAVALNLQKLSLNSHGEDVPVVRQPLWLGGFFLLLLGSIVDFIAFGLAPASLLAPLAALSLVWNMVAAPCFLKEKLQRDQIIATFIIFAGAVVTVVFSDHTSPTYTLEILKQLFLRQAMLVYSAVVPCVIMAHMLVIALTERRPHWKRKRVVMRLNMIGYAGAAGVCGGQSILFAKSTVELFKSAIAGARGLGKSAETYFIISGLVFCLLIQITYLNGGLMHHDSLSIVPVYQAYWIISGVIGGLVYFDEIRNFTSLQLGIFSLGILITIGGVGFLAHIAGRKKRGGVGQQAPGDDVLESDDDDDDDAARDKAEEQRLLRSLEEDHAFNAFLNMTPRNAAADLLLDMGVPANRVERIVGKGNVRVRTQHQKELILADMGVSQDVAHKLLRASSSRYYSAEGDEIGANDNDGTDAGEDSTVVEHRRDRRAERGAGVRVGDMESKGYGRGGEESPTTSAAQKISLATKQRLGAMVGRFEAFESEMLEGTRQRREKDEHVLEQLKGEMGQLEQTLEAEMKQRVEMNKSLQVWFAEQIEVVKEELLTKIKGHMEELQGNIDVLSDRVGELEAALEHEKEVIPADIERRGAELTARLTEFQQLFDKERLSRLEREKEITSRIAAHENEVAGELDEERNAREQKYQELKAVLEESITLRKSRTERFHVFLEKEIAVLKNQIQEESVLREKEDDEIVETLQKYTAKLQDSLRVINTTEV